MKKLLFVFLLLPLLCNGQKAYFDSLSRADSIQRIDTNTATKEETIEWITSKLKSIHWSKNDNLSSYIESTRIETDGTIMRYITEYYSTSKQTEIVTDSFDLNDIQGVGMYKNEMNFYCHAGDCVSHTNNMKNGAIEYYSVCVVEHCPFDDAMIERLNKALRHLKKLTALKEKF